MDKRARITLELSGTTLDNLIALSLQCNCHPDELMVHLLYAAIETSVQDNQAFHRLLARSVDVSVQ